MLFVSSIVFTMRRLLFLSDRLTWSFRFQLRVSETLRNKRRNVPAVEAIDLLLCAGGTISDFRAHTDYHRISTVSTVSTYLNTSETGL